MYTASYGSDSIRSGSSLHAEDGWGSCGQSQSGQRDIGITGDTSNVTRIGKQSTNSLNQNNLWFNKCNYHNTPQ